MWLSRGRRHRVLFAALAVILASSLTLTGCAAKPKVKQATDAASSVTAAGGTWLVHSFPDPEADLTGVSFVDARRGWLVGINGMIATTDGGHLWQPCSVSPSLCFYAVSFADRSTG